MELSDKKILLKSKLFYHYFELVTKSIYETNYAVVKGEPLSYYAYGDFGKRYFNDIDLLVSKEDLNFIKSILRLLVQIVTNTDQLNNIVKLLGDYLAAVNSTPTASGSGTKSDKSTSKSGENAILAKQTLINAMQNASGSRNSGANAELMRLIEAAEAIARE